MRRARAQQLNKHKLNSRWFAASLCICLAILTWVVFGQTLRHDFVNYDDDEYVYQNTNITHGLDIGGVRWAFTHIHGQNWHPLTTISHMLDCNFYGVKPSGHHFTNVLLHTVAVLLLFIALWLLTDAFWRSAFVAAVFAVHPLHVESVAWIAERKDVLSAVFFMLVLLAYGRYTAAPSPGRYSVVILLFTLGLMSKPMLVTLPLVLLLLDYWPLQRFPAAISPNSARKLVSHREQKPFQLILEKVPLLTLSVASAVATFIAQRKALGWIEQLPVTPRVTNALVSYVIYIWQMLWPVNLAVFYPHPENRLPFWEVILALTILIAVSIAAVALRKQRAYFITGWLWYLVMLVPVIGIAQVGWQARADRYTYLPQIGLYIIVTWAVVDLSASWRRQKAILGGVAAIVIAALSWVAWTQVTYWRDSETLWTHTLAVTPKNDVAENNLGIVLLGRGRVDEAISQLERAIALRPENGPAHNNLAKAFLQKGDVDKAMSHYYKLLEIEPENSEAHNIVGTVLVQHGRVKDAIEQWELTLVRDPENGNAKNNLAWVLATCPEDSIRDGRKAVELAEQALQLSSGRNAIVFRTLAAAYAEAGRFREATETAQHGLDLARRQGNSGLTTDLQNNIMLYQAGRRLRDPSLSNGGPLF